jgi:hypothetical protein
LLTVFSLGAMTVLSGTFLCAFVNVEHSIAYGIETAIDIATYGVICYGTLRETEKKLDSGEEDVEEGKKLGETEKRWRRGCLVAM